MTGPARPDRPVVLLAGPGEPTEIVYRYLAERFDPLVVVMEEPVPRATLARRRARRLGWPTVVGQIAFVTVALPLLRRSGRRRIDAILARSGLGAGTTGLGTTAVGVSDAGARADVRRVPSVNAPETAALLRRLDPAVVVVNGTRIIADSTLEAVACPFINIHAGITPMYRGVHGGYWALAEGRAELAGTTVHLVDAGIDTGGVLARAYFGAADSAAAHDSIATYPYRHLADGLPLLAEEVRRVLAGENLVVEPPDRAPEGGESHLRWHPTLWGYAWTRLRRGVR